MVLATPLGIYSVKPLPFGISYSAVTHPYVSSIVCHALRYKCFCSWPIALVVLAKTCKRFVYAYASFGFFLNRCRHHILDTFRTTGIYIYIYIYIYILFRIKRLTSVEITRKYTIWNINAIWIYQIAPLAELGSGVHFTDAIKCSSHYKTKIRIIISIA